MVSEKARAARAAAIEIGLNGFKAELASGRQMVCSQAAWINQTLRDALQPPLTEAEIASRGIATDRAEVGRVPNRPKIIRDGLTSFQAEVASGRRVVCSQAAWVNQTLRDAQQEPLTDAEIASNRIAT